MFNKKNVNDHLPLVDTTWLTKDSIRLNQSQWEGQWDKRLQFRLDMARLEDRLELEKDKTDLLSKIDIYKNIIKEEFVIGNLGLKEIDEIQKAISANEGRINDINNILKLYDL